MRRTALLFLFACLFLSLQAHASVFGQVEGIVHDPQHRPISGAQVVLKSATSDFSQQIQTNNDGAFRFAAIPAGDYLVTIRQSGFSALEQHITVASGASPLLHFELSVAGVQQSAVVTAEAQTANVDTVTPTTLVSREDIARTPGASRTNGFEMITDYVPGSYETHDMLHMRGGHQVSWLIDGVQIPNTNIGSNLGAQIDPKDIDYLEAQRGSYNADVGDRTYGVFNVVPRTGFAGNNQAELVLSAGNFYQTNDQLNFGSHSEKFAYYGSLNGNRSNYGLQPPISQVYHDAVNGYGGFASFIYNRTPQDQFRLITQLRTDYFQVPYDPDPNSWENQEYDSSGLRDGQHETDGLTTFSWVHTFNTSTLLQISPFYHYNSANYEPKPYDFPVATTSDRASNYGGVQGSISTEIASNNIQAGIYSFGQHDSYLFGSIFNDGSFENFSTPDAASGGLVEEFISDNYKITPWLTLIGGLRQSWFRGDFTEKATSPRVGAAVQIPKLNWVFRGFYGHYYQPPPLLTATGPILGYANSQNTAFEPLHGERDEEHQFGVQIPFRGWLLDADTFRTRAKNFLDHSNVGESSLYYPVTIDGALIRGWELTLRSPRLWRYGQAHLAYSNQIAEQRGAITGGLVCAPISSPDCEADFSYSPLDHDQRNTLNVGYDVSLPWRVFASTNVYYGSGFSNGDPNEQYPGNYLPQHTTFDLTAGKTFGENVTVSVTSLNVADHRVLLDNSLTFGGFHYNDPRQIYGEVRYRFHY
ncbi:TonB-dependent receptor [Acidobacterium sp. S8]|uniref:TonB-dependent receptor n=1 Tax=Acidobacterium sp. S8 TaxID=1641854 RepID=UPI00131D842C|nr:TonB-dependent receptor [Acidobacterium sp. S8]